MTPISALSMIAAGNAPELVLAKLGMNSDAFAKSLERSLARRSALLLEVLRYGVYPGLHKRIERELKEGKS